MPATLTRNNAAARIFAVLSLALFICATASAAASKDNDTDERQPIRKVLFIGDSMTGWMAERLNAYGEKNGFTVSTIVWDGSTIAKWASSPRLKTLIAEQKPDAIFVSLGMNELFEANPEKRLSRHVDKLIEAFGETPLLWIGPPSWSGHKQGATLNRWLGDRLGRGRFFSSFDLTLPRQSKSNPHPTRAGIIEWIDSVADWIPDNTDMVFKSLVTPEPGAMSRGKTFIYKRMKEQL